MLPALSSSHHLDYQKNRQCVFLVLTNTYFHKCPKSKPSFHHSNALLAGLATLALHAGTLFGVEHQFDKGWGSFLVWSFIILWVHSILVTFERWLTIITHPSPCPSRMICVQQVHNKTRYYCLVCVWREEFISRVLWYLQRVRVCTWKTISCSVHIWKAKIISTLCPDASCAKQHKVPPRSILHLPRQLWHCNLHYVPSQTRCGDHPQIKKKRDWWASLPPIMPHVLPLNYCLLLCPNLLVHHNHNSSFSCELWEATVWSLLWSHNISVWIALFDPHLIMQLKFFILPLIKTTSNKHFSDFQHTRLTCLPSTIPSASIWVPSRSWWL